MSQLLNEVTLRREIEQVLSTAVSNLIQVPGFRYSIASISFNPSTSAATGRQFTTVRVEIMTNNRPLMLGQFMGFPTNGLRGYHPNYFFGFIHGYFEVRYRKNLWNEYQIVLDVFETRDASNQLYRYVGLDEAVGEGVICPDAPLYQAMRKYDLKYVLMAGSTLSGPSLGMIESVERLARERKIRAVLDIFCGTGSLTKVALRNGASSAVCIDCNIDYQCMADNLGTYRGNCVLIPADAYQYEPEEFFDLVVINPFYEFCLSTIEQIVPKLKGYYGTLLMNLGSHEEQYWISKLRSALSKQHRRIHAKVIAGEMIALCDYEVPSSTRS